MDRRTSRRDILVTERLLKTELNTIQSINQIIVISFFFARMSRPCFHREVTKRLKMEK